MRCIECFYENPAGAQWCKYCGTTLLTEAEPASAEHLLVKRTHHRRGFFSFGTLISPTFIQLSYIIGAAVITVAGILMVVLVLTGVAPEYTDTSRDVLLFGGLTLLGVGNIVWRVLCEMTILFFRMHEAVVSLDDSARALIALLATRK